MSQQHPHCQNCCDTWLTLGSCVEEGSLLSYGQNYRFGALGQTDLPGQLLSGENCYRKEMNCHYPSDSEAQQWWWWVISKVPCLKQAVYFIHQDNRKLVPTQTVQPNISTALSFLPHKNASQGPAVCVPVSGICDVTCRASWEAWYSCNVHTALFMLK